MACSKDHAEADLIVRELPRTQGGIGRHKCASCAYEKGLENGEKRNLNFDIGKFLEALPRSQKLVRRHRDPAEAYSLGFFHGLSGANNHPVIKHKLKIASQMKDLGLHMVAKGVIAATLKEDGNPYGHAMSVVHVAHGFEILIKARIVEEHPLLIFSRIPKASEPDSKIEFEHLLEDGRTIMYSELPHRLWATTGYRLHDEKLYEDFGKKRNQIIHFTLPETSLADLTFLYSFEVVERAIQDWWDQSVLEYAQRYSSETLPQIFDELERLTINTDYELDSSGRLKSK